MTLIDKDELHYSVMRDNNSDLSRTETVAQILLRIETAPIIHAAPVVTACLVDTHLSIFKKCSNCGAFWSIELTDNIFFLHCPRCGAKFSRRDDYATS